MAYTYDPIFAADPSNAANVAANASIILFDPADAGKAPITITDVTGAALPNPITVNKNGFGPAFQHATLDRVGWFGAGFTGYFTSYEGMKAVATAAAAEAQAAASEAETAAGETVATALVNGSGRLILTKSNAATIDAGSVVGPQGPGGAPGVDGSNVLPTDTAIAAAIAGTGATKAALNAALAPRWVANTAYSAGDKVTAPDGNVVRAKSAFASGSIFDSTKWEYGTVPGGGNIPVIKDSADTRPGVWEYTHNSATGYIFHLLAGANFAAPAAILAIGNDNGDGTSILLPNKAGGKAIVIDQRSTVTSATAYGMHATQSSTAAPLVRLEQNVNGAAAALQLVAFGTPTASQHLLYVGDATGEAGKIYSGTGILMWNRNIRINNKASGEAASYLELSTSSAANSSNTKKSFKHADADYAFGATGAAGQYYPYKVAHSSSSYAFQTAPNLTAADSLNPLPTEVGTWTTQFTIGHTGISFFGATKAKKTGWSVATGTATRTAFDTTTVTLPELAQRVKALIDDLHATAGYGLLQS